jgi:hypothetical protein
MQPDKVTKRIKDKALELLDQFPNGLRYSELHSKISAFDTGFNSNTINGSIWNLDAIFPDKVYKPSKGLFRLLKHKPADEVAEGPTPVPPPVSKIREEDFYEPFADWLTNEIEDVTVAISLGGNKFKDKWGTPDVIGKRESRRSDIIKGTTEIVSAEIKTDTVQLITAFGQACAYKNAASSVGFIRRWKKNVCTSCCAAMPRSFSAPPEGCWNACPPNGPSPSPAAGC